MSLFLKVENKNGKQYKFDWWKILFSDRSLQVLLLWTNVTVVFLFLVFNEKRVDERKASDLKTTWVFGRKEDSRYGQRMRLASRDWRGVYSPSRLSHPITTPAKLLARRNPLEHAGGCSYSNIIYKQLIFSFFFHKYSNISRIFVNQILKVVNIIFFHRSVNFFYSFIFEFGISSW